MSIIIDDIATAFLVVIELGICPVTIARLAASVKIITANVNVAAALPIASSRTICVLIIRASVGSGTISSHGASAVRRTGYAAQLAIVIDDIALALAIIIEFGVMPCAVIGLAFCMQIVAASFHVTAALNV